jgi:hypothetical protein
MAQNRTWTLTETGQTRSWTLTQSSESKTFSVTPSTATRNFTVSPGVGPTGPNEVSTSTSTDITGILKGDGSTVSAAVADTDYQSVPAEGAFADGDKTKLDGIETAATADQTAAEILTAIKTVDGTGSGLDADLLDGQEATAFVDKVSAETVGGVKTFSESIKSEGAGTRFFRAVDSTSGDETRVGTDVLKFAPNSTISSRNIITVTDNLLNEGNLRVTDITSSPNWDLPDAAGTVALTSQADGSIHADDLDFAGSTDIGAALADADELMVSDGGGNTTRRKSALSRFWAYIKAKIESVTLTGLTTSGDINSGASIIATENLVCKNGDPTTLQDDAQIKFGFAGSETFPHFIATRHDGSITQSSIDFYTNDGTSAGTFPANATHGLTVQNGNVGVANTSPSAKLDVTGDAIISGDLTVDTTTLHVDSTNNRVGINDAAPSRTLDVVGDAEVSGSFLAANFYKNGGLASNHPSGITCGGNLVMGASDSITFNDNSGTWNGSTIAGDQTMSGDVTMSGDLTVDTDTLHVDSGTSQVGINISNTTPRADLHIGGGDFGYTYGDAAMAIGFLQTDDYSHFIHTGHNAGSGVANHIDFYTSDGTQNGVFPTNAIHGLTIENGKVGIGELTPATALQISGTQSFVANSGTWDGATIAGDQTMSGQLELTGQSATGDDSAMTKSLVRARECVTYTAAQFLNSSVFTGTLYNGQQPANYWQKAIQLADAANQAFQFPIPKFWDGTSVTIKVNAGRAGGTASSTDFVLRQRSRYIDQTLGYNTGTPADTSDANVTRSFNGTSANERIIFEQSFTIRSYSDDETRFIFLERKGSDAADTLDTPLIIYQVEMWQE